VTSPMTMGPMHSLPLCTCWPIAPAPKIGARALGTVYGSRLGDRCGCPMGGKVGFVCLARSLAHHHVLRIRERQALYAWTPAVGSEPAAAQEECESRYSGDSVHVLYSLPAVPPLYRPAVELRFCYLGEASSSANLNRWLYISWRHRSVHTAIPSAIVIAALMRCTTLVHSFI
jgi:hypothetical protein